MKFKPDYRHLQQSILDQINCPRSPTTLSSYKFHFKIALPKTHIPPIWILLKHKLLNPILLNLLHLNLRLSATHPKQKPFTPLRNPNMTNLLLPHLPLRQSLRCTDISTPMNPGLWCHGGGITSYYFTCRGDCGFLFCYVSSSADAAGVPRRGLTSEEDYKSGEKSWGEGDGEDCRNDALNTCMSSAF